MLQTVVTGDNSSTLYSHQFDSHYHSTHGAINESQHVFIDSNLTHFLSPNSNPSKIDILEFGFGTGLNALLTALNEQVQHIPINYTTLELYPVDLHLAAQLNYGHLLDAKEQFNKLHSCDWESHQVVRKNFNLLKHKVDFSLFDYSQKYDIVYFDAFGPRTQPELWKEPLLEQIFSSIRLGGILTTFSSQGAFRRALRNVGFVVEKIPGPPGKREMTRAYKK